MSFVGLGNESNNEEKLKPFLATIDAALLDAEPDQTFADYFYGNSALELSITEPTKDEYPKLYEMIIDELLHNDPKLKLESEATFHFMTRLAALSSDFLYEDKDFLVGDKNPNFKALQNTIAKYLDLAFDDKNFKDQISRSVDTFKAAVPKIIVAMVKHAKDKSSSIKDLKANLVDYANKLDNYFSDITQVAYKEPLSEADEKISKFFAPDYDHTDLNLIVLNQVNDFISEAEGNISAEQDLRKFLSKNKHLTKALIDNVIPLVNGMSQGLVNQNIHGSLRLHNRGVDDYPEDAVTGQGDKQFEKIFSNIAQVIYSLISFKPISTNQSLRLVDWTFNETKEVKSEKAELKSKTTDFIANPTNNDLKDFFFSNKQKIIYLYLMDTLNFDLKGKVESLNNNDLNLLIGAVRKAQLKSA